VQFNSLQPTCGKFDCQLAFAVKHANKSQAIRKKAERKVDREKKVAMKKPSKWKAEALVFFGKYTRLRDAADPCISCGRYEHEIEDTFWGKWDCGHYLSRGAHPELAFEELNAHKQCKKCNGGAGRFAKKNATVTKEYRIRLIAKIGLKNVEFLEGPHPAKHYTIEDLQQLKAHYKLKVKELENEQSAI
jgi:hypothetical protein